jgi:endonuclease/exonuclease/phosphatase family metal-dependent hydrolase
LIREGLQALSPDLVGLQEVISRDGRSQADEIAEGLGYQVAFGPAATYDDGEQFGNAVLSRLPILRSQVFPLPDGGTTQRRSVLLAECDSPAGVVPFFVTHLNWRFHESVVREAQVVALAALLKAHAPIAGAPPIVVGDFNAQPESAEIRYLKGLQSLSGTSTFLADCFGWVGQGAPETFDPRANRFAGTEREYPRRIDYVFVRGPKQDGSGTPLSAKVVLQDPRDGVWASDHYGVLAEVEL